MQVEWSRNWVLCSGQLPKGPILPKILSSWRASWFCIRCCNLVKWNVPWSNWWLKIMNSWNSSLPVLKGQHVPCQMAWVSASYKVSFSAHRTLQSKGTLWEFPQVSWYTENGYGGKPVFSNLHSTARWRSWCPLRWGSSLSHLGYFFQGPSEWKHSLEGGTFSLPKQRAHCVKCSVLPIHPEN